MCNERDSLTCWQITLDVWDLWHINPCMLFNAKTRYITHTYPKYDL